jgi:hypothetical protein
VNAGAQQVCILTTTPGLGLDSAWFARLGECLGIERSLLERLEAVLLSQRAAVERDDLLAVEDGTHAARKILRTLTEARRHRAAVLESRTGDPELTLEQLEQVGIFLTSDVQEARRRLLDTARRVEVALHLNRVLFSEAARSTDRTVRSILGVSPSATWSPAGDAHRGSAVDGGRHLNRRV